ncbi:histidinol-phosphate transaminase [Adlercreutzia sp. ZJ304]|uniref:histidinol-phosphate transaminase n=1 Tax=Adlercreutzia sp. ZJ304 TaxID=2709791 RepID=UPI0013E9DC5D|nr:histidinol-phosphate transaminase [Adlercreutzia sp. ZJ304]
MNRVRESAPQLAGIIPYDPKYLSAQMYMSANENPRDVDPDIRSQIDEAVRKVSLNRYPDPLANDLRDEIAQANGLDREWVLVGNGGDELLFDTALAWGGAGRTFLNLPPTFSVYEANARLTNTPIMNIERFSEDFSIDEDRVLAALADPTNNIAFTIIASPNNPTGLRAPQVFLEKLLNSTDALVMVDEAYFEFSRETMRPYLERHENLVILRTFSKAFSLAGVRIGYILAHPAVIREYMKVRQPYSVDAVSQAIARVVFRNRNAFEPAIHDIISERERIISELKVIPGVQFFPSDSNWVLFRISHAEQAWQYLYDNGILVRDFSSTKLLENTLRVTVGTPEQNSAFLRTLRDFALRKD